MYVLSGISSLTVSVSYRNKNHIKVCVCLDKYCNVVKCKPEDHWSCIAHLSAEDMLKSVVIEEKKENIALGQGQTTHKLSTGRPHHYGHLLQV